MITGIVNGTVFSGHPTRTTLGNTIRVWLIANYLIPNGIPFVAGDDAVIVHDGPIDINAMIEKAKNL